jgi:2-C-methyl-D-erythritol 4-phosphate cytidylyltransferase/2-C-methyl-D-erythritol 2,4-cyclodiphosphate synthase
MNATVAAIVPAAGQARRFGGPVNKVIARLGDKPVLAHTLAALSACPEITEIVVVAGAPELADCEQLVAATPFPKVTSIVVGGATRQESVAIGLNHTTPEAGLIVIHDGARPLCPVAVFSRVIAVAREAGAATAAVPVTDTVVRADVAGQLAETLTRSELRAVQTPQAFRRELIIRAHARAKADGFLGTDDAALVVRLGRPVVLVEGDRRNIKLTNQDDLAIAGHWLNGEEPMATRTGFGYDVHRLVPGRPLVLGGVEIPSELGLLGHSDADVIVHALMDALLGAAALGDIGRHFPDNDPRYAGADSIALLREVTGLVAAAGWRPVNLDMTLLLERPKIAPHVARMQSRIAAAVGLTVGAVSIKATTNEGLGSIGRGEGAAATAVATLQRME